MKTEFIKTESRYQAHKAAPWAFKITKVNGGFMAFECINDFETWKKQC